jgi:hypothetical protein
MAWGGIDMARFCGFVAAEPAPDIPKRHHDGG